MATDVGASRLDPDERSPPAISNCHVVVSDQVKAPSLCFFAIPDGKRLRIFLECSRQL